MATNKIHFIAFLLMAFLNSEFDRDFFNPKDAAEVITNDAMRCWSRSREYSHFTINPETGLVSWAKFPTVDLRFWTKEIVQNMEKFSAGKPGKSVIDEETILNEFWVHNTETLQNRRFFVHLIQDRVYDEFIRHVIDTSKRYQDTYVFNGETLTGAQLRGQGMDRWQKGLLNELDDQFFVRLSKKFFAVTGTKTDAGWIDRVMKIAIRERYSPEMAEETIKFVSLSDKANTIIQSGNFDDEVWPLSNVIVDYYVGKILDEVLKYYLQV